MEQLPLELLWDIWSFVAPVDLRRLPAVCRRWRSVMPQYCSTAFRQRYSASYAPPVALSWLRLYTTTAIEEAKQRQLVPSSPEVNPVMDWAITKGFERFVQARQLSSSSSSVDWLRNMTVAIEQDQLEIVRLLLRTIEHSLLGARMIYPETPTPIALAVQHGRILILHEMLSVCPDADLTSLLIYAARAGSVNVIEYLHHRGVSLNGSKIKVLNGERLVTNALIEAVLYDHQDIVEYLLSNHASPDLPPDKVGDAPLVVAVQTHNLRVTMMLLMAGARTAITDVQGVPLMQLAVAHAPCIARLLVRVNGYRANNNNNNNNNGGGGGGGFNRKRRNSSPDGVVTLKYAR